METLKPLSSTNTRRLASKREASHRHKPLDCSSSVRSSLACRCFGSQLWSFTPFLEGLPGIGFGSTSPISRRLLSQRLMVGTETEKVFATSSLGTPRSTAASNLNLKSFEYGFIPRG